MLIFYIILFITGLYLIWKSIFNKPKAHYPPSLPTLPIIGNIRDFVKPLIYVKIANEYKKQFPDYMTFWAFGTPIVIINNYRKAVDIFVNSYPLETAGRPSFALLDYFTEGGKDILNSNIGPQWTFQRKLVYSALRKFAQNVKLDNHVRKSFKLFKEILIENSNKSKFKGINPYEECYMLSYNITCAITFGKTFKFNDKEFINLREWVEYLNTFFIENFYFFFIPYIPMHYLPIPKCIKVRKYFSHFLNYINDQIDEHDKTKSYEIEQCDILDYMLKEKDELTKENDPNIKYLEKVYLRQTLSDIFFAGTDTTAVTTTWMLGLLALRKDIKDKIKKEVMEFEENEGREISVVDKSKLNYTQAVLNEIFRYSSIVPMGLIHEVTKDIEFDGYILPKGTQILPNLYEFHHDTEYWDEPNEFNPDRFLKDGVLVSKKDGLMPFSCGRRICVGESVAKSDLFLILCLICKELDLEWCLEANGGINELKEKSSNTQFRLTVPYFINVTESK